MIVTLDHIVNAVRRRVLTAKAATDLGLMAEKAADSRDGREPFRLRDALARPGLINIIAEFKRASPSKGVINDAVEPAIVAGHYERGGACAISVLTEPDFFRGSLADLKEVRKSVLLPILRKDFIVDEFQIFEAAIAGADAILLIVAALTPPELSLFSQTANKLGIDAVIEVHTADEMAIAKEIGADVIGVNNRDLRTFEVSLDVSRELIADAPDSALLIAESGLRTRAELLELRSIGYSGFLIGETLMRGDDIEASLKRLMSTNDES